MADKLTELFNRWWDDKGAALTPGGEKEEVRLATEIAWRSGCYIPDLPNPCLQPMQELEMTDPTHLTPAAQAVLKAAYALPLQNGRPSIAAALRAAALGLYSEEVETCGGCSYALVIEVDDIIALADELERQG